MAATECSHGAHSFLKLHPIWRVISVYSLHYKWHSPTPPQLTAQSPSSKHRTLSWNKTHAFHLFWCIETFVVLVNIHSLLGKLIPLAFTGPALPALRFHHILAKGVKMWMSPNGFENWGAHVSACHLCSLSLVPFCCTQLILIPKVGIKSYIYLYKSS